MASAIAEAYVRLRPDFSGFKTTALTGAEQQLRALQTSVLDTENAVKRAARENITSAVSQRESLMKLHSEYAEVARGAEKGSEAQIAANKLAAESARQLGFAYKEAASGSMLFGKHAASAGGEASKLERGALAGSGAMGGLGRSVAFTSLAFIGSAGLMGAMKASVEQASQLQAQMARVRDVFGTSSGELILWSKTAVSSMGLSQQKALEAAGTMGTLLKNIGQTPRAASTMSKSLISLASDMAAFKKVAPDVALNALEAALQGRTRSLKQFGIVIDNTSLKAQALSMGLMKGSVDMGKVQQAQTSLAVATERYNAAVTKHGKDSVQAVAASNTLAKAHDALSKATSGATGTLTSQQKALASVALIEKQTADQHGAFARSQGEMSVQTMKFHAALQTLEAQIGTALLPTMTHYAKVFADWMANTANSKHLMDDVRQAADLVRTAVGLLVDVVKAAWQGFKLFSDAVGGTKNAMLILLGVMAVNKFRSIGAEVLKLAMRIGLLGTASEEAGTAGTVAFAGLEAETIAWGATIKAVLITSGIGLVIIAVGLLAEYVLTHWNKVKRYTEDLGHALVGTFTGVWQIIEGGAEVFAGVVTTYFTAPFRALLEAASAVSGLLDKIGIHIGDGAKKAITKLNGYTTDWITNGTKRMKEGGDTMGAAWGGAFSNQVTQSMNYTLQQAQTLFSSSTNLFSGGLGGATPTIADTKNVSHAQAALIGRAGQVANAQVPYLYGGARGGAADLMKPTDCSGLVHNLLASVGVSVPSSTTTQFASGKDVTNQPLQTGDLLFWNDHAEGVSQPGHVTMYLGGGLMVEDPHTGGHVQIVPVRTSGFMGARRYMGVKTTTPNTKPPTHGTDTAPTPIVPMSTSISIPTSGLGAKSAPALSLDGALALKTRIAELAGKANGIVPDSVRKKIEDQLASLGESIHKGLSAEAKQSILKNIHDLSASISAELSLDKGVEKAKHTLASYRADVMKLPVNLRASLAPEMEKVRADFANITDKKSLQKATDDMKKLHNDITKELHLDAGVNALKANLRNMRTEIAAMPAAVRGTLQSQMRQLQKLMSNVVDQGELNSAKRAYKSLVNEFKTDLGQMKQAVQDQKTSFERAFGDVASAAGEVFGRLVQRHIDSMNQELQRSIDSLDANLKATMAQLDVQQKKLTPAEQALKDMQAAKAQEDRQKAAADATRGAADAKVKLAKATVDAKTAQDSFNAAQSAGPLAGETPEDAAARLSDLQQKALDAAQSVMDAQQTVADSQVTIDNAAYDAKEAALQTQADAERQALEEDLQAKRDAAQLDHDNQVTAAQNDMQLQIQNYQDQMAEQKKFFDTYLQNEQTSLEARTTTWQNANKDVLDALAKDFNLNPDWYTSGMSTGDALLQGLADAFKAAAPTLEGYEAAAAAVAKVTGTPKTAAATTQDLLTELKKQTAIASATQKQAAKPKSTDVTVKVEPAGAATATVTPSADAAARNALR